MEHVIRAWRPEARLPDDGEQLGAIYRSVLEGKRVLLVMDNARGAAQVGPLVPPGSCALLITTRWHFTLPGLEGRNLDVLKPKEARELLLKIAPRIGGEADELARRCGRLPLALRIVGSALAEHRDVSVGRWMERLGEPGGQAELVAGSLGLSLELLSAERRKEFARLGVFPGTFEARGAGAVWGTEAEKAAEALSELVHHSLVEFDAKTGRYYLHDMVRAYALSLLGEAERREAEARHAGHYLGVLRAADWLYLKGGDEVAAGLGQYDAEAGNIRAGQAWSAREAGRSGDARRMCSAYPEAGVYCLDLRLHPRERIRWLGSALESARGLKERGAEGVHLGNLGLAYADLGETRRAIKYYEKRLVIAREIGDRRGEGNALGNLGIAYRRLGETRKAIEYYEKQLVIVREIGDRRGEGNALWNMALALRTLGKAGEAVARAGEALAIYEAIEDPRAGKVREGLKRWRKDGTGDQVNR